MMKLVALCVLVSAIEARAAVCTIDSVSPLSFGSYDVFAAAPDDSTATITYSCTNVGANDSVVLQLSAGNASTFFPRELVSGSAKLAYNLFLDAARTIVWGDGTSGTAAYGPIAATTGASSVHVYGRAPAHQNVHAGSYSDSLVITIQY